MSSDSTRAFERAEDLFVARSAAHEGGTRIGTLSFAELLHFLTEPSALLLPDQQRLLFSDARLRRDFQRLKQDLATQQGYRALLQAVAASDRALAERRFSGGNISIVEAEGAPNQVYCVFEFEDPSQAPRALVMEAPNGEIAKLRLEAPDEDGVVQLLLDTSQEVEARLVRLLRDPMSTGLFS